MREAPYPHILVRKSWTGLWWLACNAEESLALMDSPTYHRSFSREGAIAKALRYWSPKPSSWESVRVPVEEID